MKVLVTGGRDWTDEYTIRDALMFLPPGTTIIHGACRGADMIANIHALSLGYKVQKFHADWKKFGKSAGMIRNKQMLEEKPDLVLAFHTNMAESKGTKNMVALAAAAGVPVVWISGQH